MKPTPEPASSVGGSEPKDRSESSMTVNPLEKVARAIEKARCPGREGPYGSYDYSRGESLAPYMIRDFRDPASPRWGCVVAAFRTPAECDAEFKRLTEEHIAIAALEALKDPDEGTVEAMRAAYLVTTAEGLADTDMRAAFSAALDSIIKGGSE